mgnify:CR=1 FL=1
MMNQEDLFKNIISHCKEYGFVFQSSEIYDGLSAVYDYGQMGAELKKNLRDFWWKSMVQMNQNIVGIDSAIFMHPSTWKASGHVDAFNDPLIDNKDSKKRYRVWYPNQLFTRTTHEQAIKLLNKKPLIPWLWIGSNEDEEVSSRLDEFMVVGNIITLELLNDLFPSIMKFQYL